MLDTVARSWTKVPGASEVAVNLLRAAAGIELPGEYVELLRFSNGGEGPLPDPYYVFCLDQAEYASHPENVSRFPDWFVFGGNGGLELFALDLTGTCPWPVLAFDGIDPDGSVRRVADDFGKFLEFVGASSIHGN